MLNNNYICALDIGSSKISAVVIETRRNRISNIYFESIPSRGIKRGAIIDSTDLVNSISKALKDLKVKSSINIKFIYTNISGPDIVTKHSRAVIPLAERGNKVITLSDMQKVNEQARILGSSLKEEIIHQIPSSYSVDSMNDILNPLGLYSHKLEADLYLICVRLSTLQSLSRAINQAGYEIKKLSLSGLATSQVIFNQESKKGINILCDIGSDLTELLIFRDGCLADIQIFTIGGDDLTKELQEALKIPFDLAEDVKRSYGAIGDFSRINLDKEILVKKNDVYKPIKQRQVCEILTSKTKLICQTIKNSVNKKVDCSQLSCFVTVGRTILLEGFLETLENILGTTVKIGRITDPDIIPWVNKDSNLTGHKYLNYLTSLGMACEALHPPKSNPVLKAINRFKEVYQEYF